MKEKIVSAAEELFFRFGIRNITMDDIARHLGISKKTIYQFFKDKDEVVHSLMLAKLEEDRIRFTKVHDEAENFVAETFAIMKNLAEILAKVNPVIFHELYKYYPETWKAFDEFKSGFILQNIERCLRKGQEQGLVRQDINIRILSRMRLENLDMGFFGRGFPHDKFSMLEVQLVMTEHFLYGVCTLKGHKLINKYKNITEE